MLEVIAIQAAQAVLRAQLFEQMEKMATTDGLTGLCQPPHLPVSADERWCRRKRYGPKCSLILTDIDHFKTVNDTYGHPTGDVVLNGVASILAGQGARHRHRGAVRRRRVRHRHARDRPAGRAGSSPSASARRSRRRPSRPRSARSRSRSRWASRPRRTAAPRSRADRPRGPVPVPRRSATGRNQSITVQQMQAGGRKTQLAEAGSVRGPLSGYNARPS